MWIFSSILKVRCNEACICLIPNQQGLTALALSIPALVTMKIYCFKSKQPPHHFTPKTFGKCPWKIIVHAHRALSRSGRQPLLAVFWYPGCVQLCTDTSVGRPQADLNQTCLSFCSTAFWPAMICWNNWISWQKGKSHIWHLSTW